MKKSGSPAVDRCGFIVSLHYPTEPRGSTTLNPVRDFTVATFVVWDHRLLLLWHRKLQRWLPPGGHIEPGELPDEAALREVTEEAGIQVELVGDRGLPVERPRQLARPAGIQLEDITPDHQHIDLIYFARPVLAAPEIVGNAESEEIRWFSEGDLARRGVTTEVQHWARRALRDVTQHQAVGMAGDPGGAGPADVVPEESSSPGPNQRAGDAVLP